MVEFKIVERECAEGLSPEFNVEVCLNGRPLRGDGELFNFNVIACFHAVCEDIDLYTCSCGVPGCAGYNCDVEHVIEGSSVRWTFDGRDGGPFAALVQKEYVFDKREFFKAIDKLMVEIKDRVSSGVKPHVCLDEYDDNGAVEADTLAERYARHMEWISSRIAEYCEEASCFEGDFMRKIVFTAAGEERTYRLYQFVRKMCNYAVTKAKARNAVALLERMQADDGAKAVFAARMRKLYGRDWISNFCWASRNADEFSVSFASGPM
jgi:hypothetical protein